MWGVTSFFLQSFSGLYIKLAFYIFIRYRSSCVDGSGAPPGHDYGHYTAATQFTGDTARPGGHIGVENDRVIRVDDELYRAGTESEGRTRGQGLSRHRAKSS